jgi:4-oxalocrotonate tautomerase
MPLVRIFHTAGHDRSYSSALSKGVDRALVSAFGVPEDDFFQITTEHPAGTGLLSPDTFLGIAHSADLVIVQITSQRGELLIRRKPSSAPSLAISARMPACSRPTW